MSKASEDQMKTKPLSLLLERDHSASLEIIHYFRPLFYGHNITELKGPTYVVQIWCGVDASKSGFRFSMRAWLHLESGAPQRPKCG